MTRYIVIDDSGYDSTIIKYFDEDEKEEALKYALDARTFTDSGCEVEFIVAEEVHAVTNSWLKEKMEFDVDSV